MLLVSKYDTWFSCEISVQFQLFFENHKIVKWRDPFYHQWPFCIIIFSPLFSNEFDGFRWSIITIVKGFTLQIIILRLKTTVHRIKIELIYLLSRYIVFTLSFFSLFYRRLFSFIKNVIDWFVFNDHMSIMLGARQTIFFFCFTPLHYCK